jgi:3-hydroxyisobutyrate dehydrogenase
MTALASGPMNAPLYQLKAPMMVAQHFAKQFPVDLMFKDLNLVLEAAGQMHVPLTATAGVRELFATARALGYGDADMAAVVQATRLAPADA